jgi:hypothetical protein
MYIERREIDYRSKDKPRTNNTISKKIAVSINVNNKRQDESLMS